MSEKRVLVVAKNPLGGIRTYMLTNCRFLLKKGYRFTFVSPQGTAFESFKTCVAEWPAVECIDAPENNRWGAFSRRIQQVIRDVRPALIHSQGLRAATEVALGNLFTRIPHIVTLHDVIVPGNDIPGKYKWLKKRIIGGITRRVNVVVPVSEDCARNHLDIFSEWSKGPCRVEVICNGVDVAHILATKEGPYQSIREQLSFAEDHVLFGFFGRFMPQKGLDDLLDALRYLDRLGYGNTFHLLVTKDPHGYRNEYLEYVRKDPVLARLVRFVEPVDEIAGLLSQMDSLVMPSLWEACPLLPAEAMVLGVPVIGSDALGLREVLAGTPSRVIPVGDILALVHEMVKVLKSPRCEEARHFIPEAIQRFDNRLAGEKLLQLYDALLDKQ